MSNYVLGFCFYNDEVLLIRKNKPAWQVNRLNGIGGKVENGEHPLNAMKREFKEETGLLVDGWELHIVLTGGDYCMWIYSAYADISNYKQTTDEKPVIVKSNMLTAECINNLRWMIPLIQDTTVMKPVLVTEQ